VPPVLLLHGGLANSNYWGDVMWRNYPKFEVGQTGVFILQPDLLASASAQSAREGEPRAYSVRQNSDVLPLTEEGRVKQLSNQ
jgi:pimeloyl-ACP methyl ester carboxylesterase